MNDVVRRGIALALMVLMVAGCTFAGGFETPTGSVDPLATATGAPPDDPTDASPTQDPTPRPTRTPKPTPDVIGGVQHLLGKDGRLTILLLGVDSRGKRITGRTDAILFVTINPQNGRVAMASVPRDMVQVPVGPGRTYGSGFTRINGLLGSLSAGVSKRKGLERMVRAMEYMAGIEIDRYAMIGFRGVRGLVSIIGGVDVKLDKALVDTFMHVRMKGREGLFLKKGKNHLRGAVALAFARTRHTDNDYERARRQQQLITAAVEKVIKNGPRKLPTLLKAFEGRILTDFDIKDGPELLALARTAKLGKVRSYVLGPSKWAGPGDAQYTTALRIDVVRRMFQKEFGPVD